MRFGVFDSDTDTDTDPEDCRPPLLFSKQRSQRRAIQKQKTFCCRCYLCIEIFGMRTGHCEPLGIPILILGMRLCLGAVFLFFSLYTAAVTIVRRPWSAPARWLLGTTDRSRAPHIVRRQPRAPHSKVESMWELMKHRSFYWTISGRKGSSLFLSFG